MNKGKNDDLVVFLTVHIDTTAMVVVLTTVLAATVVAVVAIIIAIFVHFSRGIELD